MLQRALLIGQPQVVGEETDVDPGTPRNVDGARFAHATRIHQRRTRDSRRRHARRNTAIGDVRAIRNVPTHPAAATSAAAATISVTSGPIGGT